MNILNVNGLCKEYEKFQLKDVSFSLDSGYIMGFIGSNGAGKTTTLKSIMNVVKPSKGDVSIFGKNFIENEIELKQDIAYMSGDFNHYSKKKLRVITDVVKRFYRDWSDELYSELINRFDLDEEKRVSELSQGMKVKYALALALSHKAKLIILDEPTTGLDPVARDDLLELFQELIEEGNRSILFSTHITTDLEKCADYITYIRGGVIIESMSKDDLLAEYRIVKGAMDQIIDFKRKVISYRETSFGITGLIKTKDLPVNSKVETETPTIEDIMIYYAKEERK